MNLFSLFPKKLVFTTKVPYACFEYPKHRLVVSVLLFDMYGNLYLVQSVNAPSHYDSLIPPQEKAQSHRKTDRTLGGVAIRCLEDELGLAEDDVTFHPQALYSYINRIPAREDSAETDKFIVVFGAHVEVGVKFTPNQKEIKVVEKIHPSDLLYCLPSRRQTKFMGVVEACKTAVLLGLLPWQRFSYLTQASPEQVSGN